HVRALSPTQEAGTQSRELVTGRRMMEAPAVVQHGAGDEFLRLVAHLLRSPGGCGLLILAAPGDRCRLRPARRRQVAVIVLVLRVVLPTVSVDLAQLADR